MGFQTEQISQLQRGYKAIVDKLGDGPVHLLQRSTVAAVMVSPDEWERIQKALADAEREHLAHLAEWAAIPSSEMIPWEKALAELNV